MAGTFPFEQLTGSLKIYLAPYGEPVPEVQAVPGGNWVEFGSTDGDQKIKHGGSIAWFRDNDHQGVVKGVRHQEDVNITATLVDLSMENYARTISDIGKLVSNTNASGISQMKLPLKRGPTLTEYAVLFRGDAFSPFGLYPGMYVLPRCNMASEPTPTFGKDKRAALELMIQVIEDDAQADGDELGYLLVQVS